MMSRRPNSFTAVSTAAFTSASCPTSALMACTLAFGCFRLMISAALWAASMFTSTSRTSAPSCANRMLD